MNLNFRDYPYCAFGRIDISLVVLAFGIFFLFFAFLGIFDNGYSQENQTNYNYSSILKPSQSQQLNIPKFISGSYTIPIVGFHILLPGGWDGVTYQNTAMVSPAGVHLLNGNLGPNGDKVLLVIEALNTSDFYNQNNTYGKNAETQKGDCRPLSDRYVKINDIDGKEILLQCGTNNDNKILNYYFTSGNKVIVVGLKGNNTVFDRNLDNFKNSLDTVSLDKPGDIRKIG